MTLLFVFLISSSLFFSPIIGEVVPPCDHPIYCQGPILSLFQLSSIFNDSKEFVDKPLRFPPETILQKFRNLSDYSNSSLEAFLSDNFFPAGSEVIPSTSKDWHPNPKFLNRIVDEELRAWGAKINEIWLDLSREFQHNFSCNECFSSIKSPKPFIIPGGRFREYYYWDNLWVVEGLLVSEMYQTSMDVVENLLDMVERFGFVWNGARIYYSKRSQPPVLSLMVYEIYKEVSKNNRSEALKFLEKSFTLLMKEYNYWITTKKCKIEELKGEFIELSCYQGFSEMPRPESFKEDYILAQKTSKNERSFYREINAGAETGWDFSSRFFEDSFNMTTINVSRMIPVDLNAILYKVERTLVEISGILGKKENESYFNHQSKLRKKTIMKLLFDETSSQWRDADIEKFTQNPNFYPSNFMPLWAFDDLDERQLEKVVQQIDQIQNEFIGGVPTSLVNSSQQWDYPNAWPPLQDFLIFGLLKCENAHAKRVGFELAQKYLDNAYCGWKSNEAKKGKGAMFEKYSSLEIGVSGHGGEYEVQEGFGWSNGVALKILNRFGEKLKAPDCSKLEAKYFLVK